MSETTSHREYLPAMGRESLLPWYDVLSTVTGMGVVHRALVRNALIEPGMRVLDVGAGTGTLLLTAGLAHPAAELIGVDPDRRMLDHARQKALRAGVPVRFEEGFGEALPYADASVDRVFSTLMLHHVSGDDGQVAMLAEIRRVLRPGGLLLLADIDDHQVPAAAQHQPGHDHGGDHGHGDHGHGDHGHGDHGHGGRRAPAVIRGGLRQLREWAVPGPYDPEAGRALAARIAAAGFDTQIVGRRPAVLATVTLVRATVR